MKINKSKIKNMIKEIIIKEYVVPMGYSLEDWLDKKEKDKISNKDYAKKTKGDKWKVVHGKTRPARKGKKGQKLKSTKRGTPVNKSATNLSYKKATDYHTAIELGENNNPYKKHGNHSYQPANKKNTHLDKPTSHSYMSGENKDWLGKGPVNKLIYDYLKSMGMVEWKTIY